MYMSGVVLEQLKTWQKSAWASDKRLAKDSLIHRKYRPNIRMMTKI